MKILTITCNSQINPLGINELLPKFGWQTEEKQGATNQLAYQIKVAKSTEDLSSGFHLVWDTQKEISDSSIQIPYKGKTLQSSQYYYWQVRIWDEDDTPSQWSDVAYWQMGLLHPSDWGKAKWIGLEKQNAEDKLVPGLFFKFLPKNFDRKIANNKLPQFRKQITITKKVKRATIFISGLGHYELLLNGKKVTNSFLEPGWTNYEKTIFYNTLDITNQLIKGDNVLGVLLGNGMFNVPNERYFMLLTSFGFPKLIAKIKIEFTDGQVEEISTDTSWKTTESPITYSSIFGGEDYDAKSEHIGWLSPSYNDAGWNVPLIIGDPTSELQPQIQPALEINKVFEPIAIKEIKSGIWVYDMGQNFSGIPALEVTAKGSHVIRITPSELIDKEGGIDIKNMWGEHYYQYTTKGIETETWQPRFTYYGFRYLQIEGAVPMGEPNPNNLPIINQLNGLFITSKAAKAGSFHSFNSLVNNIHALINWAMRSNYTSVMTDCPHREKLGWTEQAHLMAPSYQFSYDSYAFFIKIIQDMNDAQTDEGLVPCIVPEYTQFSPQYRESPEWGSAAIMLPWYVYRFYGDVELLHTQYKRMKMYLAYLDNRSSSYMLDIGIGDWMDLGDKEPGPSQLTPTSLVDTALYYQCAITMAKVANILAQSADVTKFNALANSIKNAFNTAFFDKELANYGSGSQTALAMPLYLGLVPSNKETDVLETLKKALETNNYQLTSGDIGHRYLLKVLEKYDLSSYIYKMHTNVNQPSYAYQIVQGATALTESWQASRLASHNHCMLGHLMEWFYTGLAGIGQAEDSCGYKTIIIKPQFIKEVGGIDVYFNCPYGLVKVSWSYNEDKIELNISIPPNTTATVYLLNKKIATIKRDNKPLHNIVTTLINNQTTVELESGSYSFVL